MENCVSAEFGIYKLAAKFREQGQDKENSQLIIMQVFFCQGSGTEHGFWWEAVRHWITLSSGELLRTVYMLNF